jgi:hypothetical protein
MSVNGIDEMEIYDTHDFEQDERSFQPLIYLEYVFIMCAFVCVPARAHALKLCKLRGPTI